jgi:hypothetical protein
MHGTYAPDSSIRPVQPPPIISIVEPKKIVDD